MTTVGDIAAARAAKAAKLERTRYRRRNCACGCTQWTSMDDLPDIGPLGLEAILDTVRVHGLEDSND